MTRGEVAATRPASQLVPSWLMATLNGAPAGTVNLLVGREFPAIGPGRSSLHPDLVGATQLKRRLQHADERHLMRSAAIAFADMRGPAGRTGRGETESFGGD